MFPRVECGLQSEASGVPVLDLPEGIPPAARAPPRPNRWHREQEVVVLMQEGHPVAPAAVVAAWPGMIPNGTSRRNSWPVRPAASVAWTPTRS